MEVSQVESATDQSGIASVGAEDHSADTRGFESAVNEATNSAQAPAASSSAALNAATIPTTNQPEPDKRPEYVAAAHFHIPPEPASGLTNVQFKDLTQKDKTYTPQELKTAHALQTNTYNLGPVPEGWRVVAVIGEQGEFSEFNGKRFDSTGLTGKIYVNDTTKDAALAFQGANFGGGDTGDMVSSVTDQGLTQFEAMKGKIYEYLTDPASEVNLAERLKAGGKMYFTGHSNGHAPAEVAPIEFGASLTNAPNNGIKSEHLQQFKMFGFGGLGFRDDVVDGAQDWDIAGRIDDYFDRDGLTDVKGNPIDLTDPKFSAISANHFYASWDVTHRLFSGSNDRLIGDVYLVQRPLEGLGHRWDEAYGNLTKYKDATRIASFTPSKEEILLDKRFFSIPDEIGKNYKDMKEHIGQDFFRTFPYPGVR